MTLPSRSSAAAEYGDFQTSADLAERVCSSASQSRPEPATPIEPTCGAGNFLIAAIDRFAGVERAIGVEVKSKYVSTSRDKLRERPDSHKTSVIHKRFFHVDWKAIVDDSPEPILVVANPPGSPIPPSERFEAKKPRKKPISTITRDLKRSRE